jgi:hypothetical protein
MKLPRSCTNVVAAVLVAAVVGAGCGTPQKPQPAVTVTINQPPPADPPIYTRWWFWTGVGALVIAGIIVAGEASKSDDESGSSALQVEDPSTTAAPPLMRMRNGLRPGAPLGPGLRF